jgi:putative transposase
MHLRLNPDSATERPTLCEWPIGRPWNWAERVNQGQSQTELDALRRSVVRGQPYGSERWMKQTVISLDLGHTLRDRGWPLKREQEK